MSTTASTERRGRWLVLLLAAVLTGIVAMLFGVSTAGTASAATVSPASSSSTTSGPALQTRVGVSTSDVILVVGVRDVIGAGQCRGEVSSQSQVVSGLCVAAEADPLIGYAESNPATGFASEYTSASGSKYYDITRNRGAIGDGEPFGVVHHGGCSEIGCLLQAVADESNPTGAAGGTMRTIRNRPPYSPIPPGPPTGLGTPATACPACQAVLDNLGVSR